jgi:nucleotidyltransferase substrate binding protein (TIGR01987 family)
MYDEDIRWRQRFENFQKALGQLESAVLLRNSRELSTLEKQGLIQAFEFTHELAWQVLEDWFAYQGNPAITGSRDASREAFNKGLVEDGEGWMEMIRSRNQTSHTYNQATADDIVEKTCGRYLPLFQALRDRFRSLP